MWQKTTSTGVAGYHTSPGAEGMKNLDKRRSGISAWPTRPYGLADRAKTHLHCNGSGRVRFFISVKRLNFSEFDKKIQSVEGGPGCTAIDRRILFALWLYAYTEGIGSARRIHQLTLRDDVYKWLAGGVSLNHHTISDFRSQNQEAFQELLRDSIAVILKENVFTIRSVAVDGTKIRAKAKRSRFHTEDKIKAFQEEAQAHIKAVEAETERETSKKQKASRERVLRERIKKCEEAQEALEEIRKRKKKAEHKNARVSITEPEARVIHFSDGSYHPGYNVQVASDAEHDVILAIEPTQDHDDSDGLRHVMPAVEKSASTVETVVTDSQYSNYRHMDELNQRKLKYYATRGEDRDQRNHKPRNKYFKENMNINIEKDELECPAGNIFPLRSVSCKSGARLLRFTMPQTCHSCSQFDSCSPDGERKKHLKLQAKSKRHIDLIKQLQERTDSEEGKKLLRQRFQEERINAYIKAKFGVSQFVQGLARVRSELQLLGLAYNFIRWKYFRMMKLKCS